jgi:hypothetical protein
MHLIFFSHPADVHALAACIKRVIINRYTTEFIDKKIVGVTKLNESVSGFWTISSQFSYKFMNLNLSNLSQ